MNFSELLLDCGVNGVTGLARKWLIDPVVSLGTRTVAAQWNLKNHMPKVTRAFGKVRTELSEVGLLYEPTEDGDRGYLNQIELVISGLPSVCNEAGYVFERVPWYCTLVGYREGVIYLPSDLPATAYVPGGTLTDVIRHEYAHAWHWLEPEFFERPWFRKAFGGNYEDTVATPLQRWSTKTERTRTFIETIAACRNEREVNAVLRRSFANEFVSGYAATLFCEDFAETFMTFLRYRHCLDKFASRTEVYRKLRAVEKAVNQARKELGT